MSGGRPPIQPAARLPDRLPCARSPPTAATAHVSPVSRRAFLAGAAATGSVLVGGVSPVAAETAAAVGRVDSPTATTTAAGAAPVPPVTVMTQNLYVGANLFSLFALESPAAVPGAVADLLAAVDASDPARRLAAVVDDIDRLRPHLVGLQEVALIRVQSESDSDRNATPNATAGRVDFLRLLTAELARRNLPYSVVGRVVNADVEVAAEDRSRDGELMDVRLTDRDVILARDDVVVRGSLAKRYGVALTVPYGPERMITVHRGYCAAEVVVDGRDLVFVTTHLETPLAPRIQYSQALELGATFQAVPVPVVLAGDFNSPPGSDSYRLVTEIFADADAVAGDGTHRTCCRPPRLATDEPALARRIDFVFTRGDVRVRHTEPVGVTPLAPPSLDSGDGSPATDGSAATDAAATAPTGPTWPSDHAGLLAGLDVTPFEETLRRQRAAGLATARQSVRVATKQAELVSQLLAARLDRAGDEAASGIPPLVDRVWDASAELGAELSDDLRP